MNLISSEEYDRICRHNIVYDDLRSEIENFYEYRSFPYCGIGFGDSEVSGKLNKLYVYKDGLMAGICRRWYHSGVLEEEELKDTYQYGYKRKWNEKGDIIFESIVLECHPIYEISIKDNGEVDEKIYKNNIMYFKGLVHDGKRKTKKYTNSICEKRFIDTEYYNKLLDIFEGLDDKPSEEQLNIAVVKLRELTQYENEHRLSVYNRTINIEELEIRDGMYLNNGELYTGIITKFIDDEDLNCNMLYSLTECIDGKKNGLELIWDFEGRLNPEGIEKYGVHYEEYCWWSKEILKEIRYFEDGQLLENQEWNNNNLE